VLKWFHSRAVKEEHALSQKVVSRARVQQDTVLSQQVKQTKGHVKAAPTKQIKSTTMKTMIRHAAITLVVIHLLNVMSTPHRVTSVKHVFQAHTCPLIQRSRVTIFHRAVLLLDVRSQVRVIMWRLPVALLL
jgi:hypothetical protein